MSELTLGGILAAMKKNGYKHIRGAWMEGDYNNPTGACILGQTGLNLRKTSDSEFWFNDLEDVKDILNELPLHMSVTTTTKEEETNEVIETSTVSLPVGDALIDMNDEAKTRWLDDATIVVQADYYSYDEIVAAFEKYIKDYNYSLNATYIPLLERWDNVFNDTVPMEIA